MANNNSSPAWPGWETVRLIGRGSFGAVYEIERDVFGHKEKAAMKLISIPQSDSDIEELYDSGYDEASVTATFKSHLERIVNEYSLMREMNGAANVVNCDDFRFLPHEEGIGWDIFIKMELLTPLTKALDRQPSDAQVIRIAKDMCNALILCRKYGIIHRDIKPQNIFVSKNGDYKLGDFGIAKTIEKTSGGTKIGTYKYMAPEVYNNQPYNHTADIYSLGLVLHWMLNERRSPFMPLPPAPAIATEEDEARAKRLSGTPIPPPAHGSAELQRIVLKACAYDSKDRYQSAEEMLRDLEALGGKAAALMPEQPVTLPVTPGLEEATTETVGLFGGGKQSKVAAKPEPEEDATVSVSKRPTPPAPQPETEEEDEGTGGKTVGAFDRKDEPSAPPPKRRKWPVVLGVVGGILALLGIAFFTIHSWNPATCTEPETCKICGKTRGEALGHRYTEATCLEDAVCTVCGDVSKGAIGHDWGEPEYTWSADNSSVTAKRVCKNDQSHVETETVKTSSEVTAAASCTENGTTTYTAAFTNSAFGTQTKAAEDIAAIGHDWGEPSYTWSADNSNVTAKRTCSRCNSVETEEAQTKCTTTKTTTVETTTYSATFQNPAFQTQTRTTEFVVAKEWQDGTVQFFLKDGVLTISGEGTIESLLDRWPNWSDEKENITKVIINSGITAIGRSAFQNCQGIVSIVIPDSVKSIGKSCFSGCSNLKDIVLPKEMTTIEDWLFYNCTELTNVAIPQGIVEIGYCAFSNCKSLINVTIPSSVNKLGDYAFEYCKSLEDLTIPGGIAIIGNKAFQYCTRLGNVTILPGVINTGSDAFQYCSNLTSIKLPDSVASIPNSFTLCEKLETIYYSGSKEQWNAIDFSANSFVGDGKNIDSLLSHAIVLFY